MGGTWYVVRSSLGLWLSGGITGRHNPSVTYAPLPGGQLVDTVRFTQGGQPHLIVGLDTPDGEGGYVWRGLTPLTRLTKSRWHFLQAGGDWTITMFERTLFTPAGLNVYARTPYLLPPGERAVWEVLERSSAARPFLNQLFAPVHGEMGYGD